MFVSACSGPPAASEAPWPIPSRFALISVNDQPLPAFDSTTEARVMTGVLELYRPDSLRLIQSTRDLWHDRLPCEALRVMAETTGTMGLGAVTDTSTARCDELRVVETDTQVVAYGYRDGRFRITDGDAEIRGDTITIREEFRHVTVGEPTRTSLRSFRYARLATPAASREPQN
jgi:hypothetical protein